MRATSDVTIVDFWFDPVCPYSWTASRWLAEVRLRRPLDVRHHVMSLYLLNEHRTDVAPAYRRNVEAARGPARVATAVVTRFGPDVLGAFYTAFG
jgi:predicted DsbA family dithiol-disulfide isomerase